MVTKLQLSGHKGPVTCLDHSSKRPTTNKAKINTGSSVSPCCLLSGSEDGTTRLWDLRSSTRASVCIIHGQEVTSVGFHPIFDDGNDQLNQLSKGQYPFTM